MIDHLLAGLTFFIAAFLILTAISLMGALIKWAWGRVTRQR